MPDGEPTPREKAFAWMIAGLLAAVASPFLLPAGVAGIAIGVLLAHRGFAWRAITVVLASAFMLTLSVATALR